MFWKNLIIAFRSLKKSPFYALSNLVGLTIGITCCLLILSFVKYELSFDEFHKKRDRIYRVNYDVLMGGNQTVSPSVPLFVSGELKKRFPEVEDATRFMPEWSAATIKTGDLLFDEKGFAYADPNFFKIFDFTAIYGDLSTALERPNTLVITRDMAGKYFGKENPIGEHLLFNNKNEYTISAVIENVPANSHFHFDFLTSIYNLAGVKDEETKISWNNPNYSTYLLLKPGSNPDALSQKIEHWVNPPAETSQVSSGNELHLRLEPLNQVHFNTQVYNFGNLLVIADIKYIRIFVTIAILVLLIACANYINLATAKNTVRAKEVGVRKTIGAGFWHLFVQYISESFLLVITAVSISGFAVYQLLPYLNQLLGKEIPFYIFDTGFLLCIIAGSIVLSLLAGFYPSMTLSRMKPLRIINPLTAIGGKPAFSLRKVLVVFQFTISIVLILGTIIVRNQLEYMQSEKLGLDKDQVLVIRGNADLNKNLAAFGGELKKIIGVQDVSMTWRSPFRTVVGNGFSLNPNPADGDDWHVVGGIAGDQNYLSTLGIELIAGRNFDATKIKGDSTINEFIVNEAFLRHYNLKPEDAIGKNVLLGLTGNGPITGVMKDFHFSSMHSAIAPVVLFNNPQYFGSLLLRVDMSRLSSVIADVEKSWKSVVPMRPFSYSFLDEEYDAMYRTEQRLGTLMSFFCGLAIVITCLGLVGLMAFMVVQRTKEIGIRKVLGASVANVAALLSKDFLKLVLVAIIIALPVAYWAMNKWLQDFAYRIGIEWWVMCLAGLIAVLIALVTVSFQAIRAAVANPVESIRRE